MSLLSLSTQNVEALASTAPHDTSLSDAVHALPSPSMALLISRAAAETHVIVIPIY